MRHILLLFGIAILFIGKIFGQPAPANIVGPLKNINKSYGFSLQTGFPITGNTPVFDGNQFSKTPSGADFGLGFSYGNRFATKWPEIGLSFNRYSTGYKTPEQDTLSYRLQSNYLGIDLRYCISEKKERSRNLITMSLTPGISLRQRNLTYIKDNGKALYGSAENYNHMITPFNFSFLVSAAKEFDFTQETTSRLELFTRWNTVFTKNGQGVISQLAMGLKLSFLYTQ
jgi:hypothetical protein